MSDLSVLPIGDDATETVPLALAAFRPSEYTAALIQGLRRRSAWVRDANVLEIGSGSGVVLAAGGKLGAASLCGVEIESVAVACSGFLLHRMGFDARARVHCGDMWRPVAGSRFDLIAANLPQFPMPTRGYEGRLPSWSSGGADGRRLLDRLLDGLAAHLAPGGRAIITHNGFVGLERSRALLRRDGLALRVAATTLVYIAEEKLELMTPAILDAEEGRSIHRYGPHAFADMHVVEIGTDASLD